jgi:ribonuclease HIII
LAHIGTDESGKGDFFGPLVVAAAYVRKSDEVRLLKLGVRDSKRLSDERTIEIANSIDELVPNEIVRINPRKYNRLMEKFENLNVLLAWAHAKAIENILKRVDCRAVLVDRFSSDDVLPKMLEKKKIEVSLSQMPAAESDTAVAAASILARAQFILSLRKLSNYYGVDFPKGSAHVKSAGKFFCAGYGFERLSEVAKMHFKTAESFRESVESKTR